MTAIQIPPDPRRADDLRRGPWVWPVVVLGLLLALGVTAVWAWNVALPYYALSPGPVQQVEPLIRIEADEADGVTVDPPGGGDLFFLTVSLQQVNVYEYLEARADGRVDLVARRVIRPEGVTQEEFRETSLSMMEQSKKTATCVALRRVGYDPTCEGRGAEVAGFVEGTPAGRLLEEGDVIVAIEGDEIGFPAEAVAVVSQHEIGQTLTITLLRRGERISVDVPLVEHVEEPGQPMVGVVLRPIGVDFRFPFPVEIDSQNVGGPSAGLMYALGIVDRLTEGDLTGGRLIAGTGTIDLDGRVGSVGGIRQKVFAARAAQASHVLVPRGNYQQARSAAGDQVEVVPVDDVDEALRFLEGLDEAA